MVAKGTGLRGASSRAWDVVPALGQRFSWLTRPRINEYDRNTFKLTQGNKLMICGTKCKALLNAEPQEMSDIFLRFGDGQCGPIHLKTVHNINNHNNPKTPHISAYVLDIAGRLMIAIRKQIVKLINNEKTKVHQRLAFQTRPLQLRRPPHHPRNHHHRRFGHFRQDEYHIQY